MTTLSPDAIATNSFDHVALWVSDRRPLTELLCERFGMHVIEGTDDFTLVGADAREGKLTLFEAEGERDPGPLERVILRVNDLDDAVSRIEGDYEVERDAATASFTGPQGLGIGLVRSHGLDYDLHGVVLRVGDPDAAAAQLAELGFIRRDGHLAIADRTLTLGAGGDGDGDAPRPLLNHLAMLVDSAEEVRRVAESRGIEVEKWVDAENTLAVFLRGPERVLLEYVEHKPGFSLT
jgi:catechol 2,3-dioxygenase-like lactoylglutathione lyase family enzyme